MQILENYNLKNLNTFGVEVKAKYFVEISNEIEILELFKLSIFKENKKLFLGGGSNVLFTRDFVGLVILNKLLGIEIVKESDDEVEVRSMGGVWWSDLVSFAVDRNLWGIENLALVPGTVGAAPMQNIGAYGVELKDSILSVEAFDVETGEKRIFLRDECVFGYRESVFKNILKDKYFISAVNLKLSKKENKKLEYRVLKEYLEKNNIEVKTSKDVANAVSDIRRSKLPDPKVIGNAGSFFKNVFISEEKLKEMLLVYKDIPYFNEDGAFKIPTAWMIEQCGYKGKRVGSVGVHDKQALILVNYGGGRGEDIYKLALEIIDAVFEKFGLKITPEVNLI